MFCKYCGKELNTEAKFCTGCGNSIVAVSDNPGESIVVEDNEKMSFAGSDDMIYAKKKGAKGSLFFACVIAVLILLIAGAVYFFFLRDSGLGKAPGSDVASTDIDKDQVDAVDLSEKVEDVAESDDVADKSAETETDKASDGDADSSDAEDLTDTDIDYDAIFDTFIDEQDFVKEGKSYAIEDSFDGKERFSFDFPEKYLNYITKDLDDDGCLELLMVKYDGNQDISFEIYEAESGKCNLVATQVVDECIFPIGEGVTDFYIYADNMIMIESSKLGYLVSDGVELFFRAMKYDGEKISLVSEGMSSGSDIQEDDSFIDSLGKAGVAAEWSPLFGRRKTISDYASKVKCIGRLKENYIVTADKAYKAMVKNKPLEFAELIFYKDFDGPINNGTLGESNGDYILPDSNSRRLDISELEGLSKEECRLARNELYARHGRDFDDEELKRYFESKDWYEATMDADDFAESMLSDIEMYNRDLIVEYEKDQGYR